MHALEGKVALSALRHIYLGYGALRVGLLYATPSAFPPRSVDSRSRAPARVTSTQDASAQSRSRHPADSRYDA